MGSMAEDRGGDGLMGAMAGRNIQRSESLDLYFGEKGRSWFKSRSVFVKWYMMYIHHVNFREMVCDVHTVWYLWCQLRD